MQDGDPSELRMLLIRILKRALPDETPAARLQQLGLFTLIYLMERDDVALTAVRLAQLTGLSEPQVHTHVHKLLERGLIERNDMKGKHGRGRAFQLTVKRNAAAKRLIKAIDKATGTPVAKNSPARKRLGKNT